MRQSTRDISQASPLGCGTRKLAEPIINWELARAEENLRNLYQQWRQLINWELELIAWVETHNLLCHHICNPQYPNNEHWELVREVQHYRRMHDEICHSSSGPCLEVRSNNLHSSPRSSKSIARRSVLWRHLMQYRIVRLVRHKP
jgi:hypothetical protein